MPTFYRTFKRSATSLETFSRARKTTEETGLTLEQARERCEQFNKNRTRAQIQRGTKLEFEKE